MDSLRQPLLIIGIVATPIAVLVLLVWLLLRKGGQRMTGRVVATRSARRLGRITLFLARKGRSTARIGWTFAFTRVARTMRGLMWLVLFLARAAISSVRWLGKLTRATVIIFASGVAVALVVVVLTIAFIVEPLLSVGLVAIVLLVATVSILATWRQVGTAENPYLGVVTRFGNPQRVVKAGRHWMWPWEKVRLFPPHQYQIPVSVTVVTKARGNVDSQELKLEVIVYFRWPTDRRLMTKTFFTVPVADLTQPHAEVLQVHLSGAVESSVRHVMSELTYEECLRELERIESRVKDHLLQERGNPFRELGVPAGSMDVTVAEILLPPELVVALRAKEMARRTGGARVVEASLQGKAEIEEAEGVAEAVRGRVSALKEEEVPPWLAAVLVEAPAIASALRSE